MSLGVSFEQQHLLHPFGIEGACTRTHVALGGVGGLEHLLGYPHRRKGAPMAATPRRGGGGQSWTVFGAEGRLHSDHGRPRHRRNAADAREWAHLYGIVRDPVLCPLSPLSPRGKLDSCCLLLVCRWRPLASASARAFPVSNSQWDASYIPPTLSEGELHFTLKKTHAQQMLLC